MKSSYSFGNGGECVEVGVWVKSSHSGGNGGECVELSSTDGTILVRDSKNPAGPVLRLTTNGFRNLLDSLSQPT